jgi:hypothetical protein
VPTIEFTEEERDAMIEWAGMAGVGFRFGLPSPRPDPNVSALRKLEESRERAFAGGPGSDG